MSDIFHVYMVVIDKSVGLVQAKKTARRLLERKKGPPYLETETTYKFKHIPRGDFDLKSFKRHQHSPQIEIFYGKLKISPECIDVETRRTEADPEETSSGLQPSGTD